MSDPDSQATYRERVYEAFADRSRPFAEAVQTALSAGTERLGVGVAFLTRIEDGTQYIEHSVGDHDIIEPGHTCPLDEAYCRRTLELDGQLSVQDATADSTISDAAYWTFELRSYIGCTVVVDETVYGTVCFADEAARETAFTEAESLFVELVARLVGQAIERREHAEQQAEQTARLRAEKRRLEAIAENTFDIIYRINTDGEFTFVSGAVERVLGYDPDAVVGDNFASYLTDPNNETAFEVFERLLSGESVEGVELRYDHCEGHPVTIEMNATPLIRDGEVTGVQGVGRDVTERKDQEAELRIRTRAMEVADIPITMADATRADNPIIYANEAFERVTGYSRDQILGETWHVLQGPGTDPDSVATLMAGIDANRPVTVQLLSYRRDGTTFWNRITVTPIRDAAGTVERYLWFQEDVTDQQRTTCLVDLLNRVLRHNLRNELTVIQGFTDFIPDPPDDTDVQAGIRRPLRRLVSLSERARQLEQLSRADPNPVRIDPGTVVGTVVAGHRDRTQSVTIETDIDTSRDICAGTELERAIDELVTNAVTHGRDDVSTVSLSAHDEGDAVVVTVRDDGPGISDHEMSVIDRGHETPLQHGKGLGLWLVNWIVTQYGGSFDLAVDDGTVATLRLPAAAADQSVTEAARRPTALHQ